MYWYLIVVLIVMFLMDDSEDLFVCFLSSVLKCFFIEISVHVFCPFHNWIAFLILSLESSSYFLNTSPFSEMWFAVVFFQTVASCFILLVGSLAEENCIFVEV